MRVLGPVCALLIGAALLAGAAAAEPVRTANVEAELHSARAAIAPGERFTIALRQVIREGWHTYWRNPGDSGEPTQLTWRNPAGFEIGEIEWPAPEAIPFATLVNFGYSGEVLFPIEVTAPASLRPGQSITLTADGYWLVCSDICIPEEATLTLTLPVAAQGRDDAQWARRIDTAVAALPRTLEGVAAHVTAGDPARLTVAFPGAGEIRNARFFAFDRDVMQASAPQSPRAGPAGLSFELTPGVADNLGRAPLGGVVAFDVREGGSWVRRGVEILAQPGDPLAGTTDQPAPMSNEYPLAALDSAGASAAASDLDSAALLAAAALAFLGGLILNIMPCVLPVLAVKGLSFAGGVQAGAARRHGSFYFIGVMATFLALAVLLIVFRSAGAALGWGFQLQAPWATTALALLFFTIGLNLLGLFHVGGALQGAGSTLAGRGGEAGSFFTGALAVIAATPCAAPFMATAVGAALMTHSALATLLIFGALGLGFAAPLTALHFAPGLQHLIPKPGAWMERARNVLAFPMFGAAIWLAWVLAQQTGPAGVLALLSLAAALAFVLFVARWGRAWMLVGVLVVAGTLALAWRPAIGLETQSALVAEPWSPERVTELRAERRAVFVNFTAAWCVSCKVNEGLTLDSPRVARAFADANVAYLKADWTNRDETIAAALAEHGRAGVPLYLFYPADGGQPVILPQLLSERVVLETIGGDRP